MIVSAPEYFSVNLIPIIQRLKHEPEPARLRALSVGPVALTLRRVNERQIEIDRQRQIFRWAVQAIQDRSMTVKTTTKTTMNGNTEKIVETTREVPIWMQALRIAQQAALQLSKLNDKPPPPVPDVATDAAHRGQRPWQALPGRAVAAQSTGSVCRQAGNEGEHRGQRADRGHSRQRASHDTSGLRTFGDHCGGDA